MVEIQESGRSQSYSDPAQNRYLEVSGVADYDSEVEHPPSPLQPHSRDERPGKPAGRAAGRGRRPSHCAPSNYYVSDPPNVPHVIFHLIIKIFVKSSR